MVQALITLGVALDEPQQAALSVDLDARGEGAISVDEFLEAVQV